MKRIITKITTPANSPRVPLLPIDASFAINKLRRVNPKELTTNVKYDCHFGRDMESSIYSSLCGFHETEDIAFRVFALSNPADTWNLSFGNY